MNNLYKIKRILVATRWLIKKEIKNITIFNKKLFN